MEKRIDKLTKEAFIPKRRNQLFASAKNRIDFHNKISNTIRLSKAFIDKPLKQNHKILMELLNANEVKSFNKDFLSGKGFNFSTFTHYESYYDKVCFAIYNFIIVELHTDKPFIKIFRKK